MEEAMGNISYVSTDGLEQTVDTKMEWSGVGQAVDTKMEWSKLCSTGREMGREMCW